MGETAVIRGSFCHVGRKYLGEIVRVLGCLRYTNDYLSKNRSCIEECAIHERFSALRIAARPGNVPQLRSARPALRPRRYRWGRYSMNRCSARDVLPLPRKARAMLR